MKNIGSILKKIRKDQNKTQDQVFEDLGMTQSYLSRVENGIKIPHMEYVIRLINYYGVSDFILVMWHMIDVNDIPQNNKGYYGIMKSSIDGIFDELFKTSNNGKKH